MAQRKKEYHYRKDQPHQPKHWVDHADIDRRRSRVAVPPRKKLN